MSEITKRIKTLQDASRTLQNLSKGPIPKGLPSNQQKDAEACLKWLDQASRKCKTLADKGESELKKATGKDAKQTAEVSKSYASECAALQKELQGSEDQYIALISNIMKQQAETIKNIINNLKA